MANGHGGARQGTAGKGYVNRTDLLANRAPSTPTSTPASGGMPTGRQPPVGVDEIPDIGAPTQAPNMPITSGLEVGPGPGPSAMQTPAAAMAQPPDPVRIRLQAAMMKTGNLDFARIIQRMDAEGR